MMATANVNGTRMSPFQNPDRKPLEKLELVVQKDGDCRKVAALSKEWTEKRQFLRYEVPRIYDQTGAEITGAKDRWLELVTYIAKDLEWLLRLPFYKFWSNVIYERSIVDSLVAFLQESPTFHNLESFPNDAVMRNLLERLSRDVLIVFARLVISKETKEEFLSYEEHGNFLYEEFLITVPMMLDICQLYGRENGKVVEKIISTVIKLQPAYNDDFNKTVDFFIQVFKTVERRFEDRAIPLAAGAVPLCLESPGHVITLENLDDLVIHLLDASSNISIFLEVYPPANDFLCTDEFVNEIIHVYGNSIPQMYKRLDTLAAFKDETLEKYTELKHHLDVTRIELLKIFRAITYHNIARILEQPNPSKVSRASEHVQQFVNFLDKAMAEKEFMLDYHAFYPIGTDLDLIAEISHDVDPVKLNFIKRSVYAEFVQPNLTMNSHLRPIDNNATTSAGAGMSGSPHRIVPVVTTDGENARAKSDITAKSKGELDSLISEVKDILCELGEGFIERCLKHYNYDATAVINSVLENSLPENLKTLDRTLPYIPPDSTESSAAMDQLLGAERLNVFDNDEFDVMTRDNIDTSRVHKGKRKDKYKNLNQLLDDKSYRKYVGNIYEKFSIIQDEYEDEYDDTYESHDVGLRGVDEPVEMDGRAFTTPRVLRWNAKFEPGGEDEDEEDAEVDEGSSRVQNSRENFHQDPAELRARAEQRRMSKRGGGTRGNGGRGPQADLVGKPKGQGNDKNVLANRDKKNTHKASRSNHNRRSGAEHKRRQGMVPS